MLQTYWFQVRHIFFNHCPHLTQIIDTSEYPGSHSLFCYTPDSYLSAKLQQLIDDIAEEPPRPLGETVYELMASVARIAGQAPPKAMAPSSSEESDGESEGYDAYEDYDDLGGVHAEQNSVMSKLQE